MPKRRKTVLWIIGIVGILLFLFLALLLVLPYLINLDPVRERILATISREVRGEVEFRQVDLSFFPRPRVAIQQGSLSIPGKIDGTLESLTVYPEILPLFRGRVRVARLQVESPEIKMELPKREKEKEKRPEALSLETIPEALAPVFGLIEANAPGLVLLVERGRLDISEESRSIFSFENIDGSIRLPPGRLKVDLRCKSNLWESLSLEGWLDSKDLTGTGSIDLAHLQLERLPDHLFPASIPRVTDSRFDLKLDFRTDGLKTLEVEVQGSIPYVTLRYENKELALKGRSLRAALHMDEEKSTLSLAKLDLVYPQLNMSGKLLFDPNAPLVSVELEGREVDVVSTRRVALALGEKEPTIQEVFDLVRGGKVPLITLSAQGSSLADLDDTKNIFIKGSIVDGNIFIRGGDYGWEGVDLNLEDAKGDVIISKGILEGKNLEARWENERVRDGTLRLGFEGENAPFHLEAEIEADLSQLAPLLKQLMKQEKLAAELRRIYEIKGKGVGRLVVGERIDSITARVDVSELNLFARYERIPYGLQVNSGQVLYDGQKIGLKDLNGKFGKSSFSEVTAQLGFAETPGLEILSGRFLVSLEEIYSWLSSLEGLDDVFKDIESVTGTLGLSTLNLKGPLLSPKDWRFRATGEVENLAVNSRFVKGPVKVARGRFEVIPEKLSVTDFEATILDASVGGSGTLNGYQEGLEKADFTFQGNLGPEIMEWGASLIDLPPKLKFRSPLSISQAHASWDRDGKTLISGNFAVKDGPEVAVDVALNPDELMIKNLLIQDETSQATFSATLREKELHLNYRGHLNRMTLDRLLVKNEILTGRFDGDFEAHLLLDHPMRSTAQGKLQGTGLGYPLNLKAPFTIEDFSLNAVGNRLNLKSASLTWGKRHITLDGNLKFSEMDFMFDMNLVADALQWDKVVELFKKAGGEGRTEQGKGSVPLPLGGILRIKSEYFKYDRFTWRPFHASVTIDRKIINVAISEASLCGISTPGVVRLTPEDFSLDFKLGCQDQEPGRTLTCLLDQEVRMTGSFDFKGDISARGGKEELAKSLKGGFEFAASDGHIYRALVLAKILGYLNLTEILMGKLPDMGKEGLRYDFIKVKANLENRKLRIEEAILEGPSVELAAQGEINLIDQKLNLTVLVAPHKTMDRIVKRVPVARSILGRTLISYPVRVRGDLKNPKVSALSPSAVGSELFGMMKRTVGLPIKMVQPLLPGNKKEEGPP